VASASASAGRDPGGRPRERGSGRGPCGRGGGRRTRAAGEWLPAAARGWPEAAGGWRGGGCRGAPWTNVVSSGSGRDWDGMGSRGGGRGGQWHLSCAARVWGGGEIWVWVSDAATLRVLPVTRVAKIRGHFNHNIENSIPIRDLYAVSS
jgi:hypothetical protein